MNKKWVDKSGKEWNIKDMSSKHLFYSMLMIWNSVCKKDETIWKNKNYVFPKYIKPRHFRCQFNNLRNELLTRDDLGKLMRGKFEILKTKKLPIFMKIPRIKNTLIIRDEGLYELLNPFGFFGDELESGEDIYY